MALGNKLEQLRKRHGWSRAEVARRLDLKYTTYVGYEKGDREPGHLFLIEVAKLYSVTVDYLLETEVYEDYEPDPLLVSEEAPKYGRQTEDTNDLLELLKNDPDLRMVAKIRGQLTEEGKKDLTKYAEYLKSQRDTKWDD